jgi:hypothetical protein
VIRAYDSSLLASWQQCTNPATLKYDKIAMTNAALIADWRGKLHTSETFFYLLWFFIPVDYVLVIIL